MFRIATVFAALLAVASAADPFSASCDNAAFKINPTTVTMKTGSGSWGPGQLATVTFEGETTKMILAGTLKFQVYETYLPSFISSGNSPYFKCDHKGCNPSDPIALTIDNPYSKASNISGVFQFVMPAEQIPGYNAFRVVFWGEDQDHYPYDFSCTINYNFTQNSVKEAPVAPPTPVTPPAITGSSKSSNGAPFVWHCDSGTTFKVQDVSLDTKDGTFHAQASATITMTGSVQDKLILAGTTKYKLYELGEYHFVQQGSLPYFTCDNKGCDRGKPLSLHLEDINKPTTNFTLVDDFVMPSSESTGKFTLTIWGSDQDHYPYDFSCSISYQYQTSDMAPSEENVHRTRGDGY